jgi:hypothetical protein
VATALIIVGVLTGILGLLDIFLSITQKDKLDERVLVAWDWLSDAQRVSLLGWLLKPSYRVWFLIVATVIALLIFQSVFRDLIDSETDTKKIIAVMLAAELTGLLVGYAILRHILAQPTKTAPIWAIGYLALTFAVLLAALEQAVSTVMSNTAENVPLNAWLVLSTATPFIFSFITTVPLLVIVILQAILFLAEAIVRKIAESPKGIVMAFSGIATAIGGILKAFA